MFIGTRYSNLYMQWIRQQKPHGYCVKEEGGGEGECERERALGLLLCHSPQY